MSGIDEKIETATQEIAHGSRSNQWHIHVRPWVYAITPKCDPKFVILVGHSGARSDIEQAKYAKG